MSPGNFFQLFALFLLVNVIKFFSYITVISDISVTITVTVNLPLFFSYFTISVSVSVN